LTLTARIITWEDLTRRVVDAFMNEYPAVSARLLLIDRQVNLIDEGIDVALRIAHLILNTNRTCTFGSALSKPTQNDQIEWFRCN
jgi:DNA-binding transcriptional LysR family regulator